MISQSVQLIRNVCCVAILAVAAAGCGSQPAKGSLAVDSTADKAVQIALQQVGVPYRYGGASPNGFDCSGLVHYSYSRAGKMVPRTTSTLWSGMSPVAADQLRKGDILFFKISGKMSHVGIYVGAGQFVHAPSSGTSVSVASLRSDFYREALFRAGRP
jgi:murein DD-endopeptidase